MDGSSPYVLMFGPDKCGSNNKVHVIFKHKSPKDGEVEEKHLKDPPKMPSIGKAPHLYTLLVNTKDHTYEVKIDGKVEKEGSIFEDFDPPFNPPKMIDDPEDSKPEDWVDEKQIPDPTRRNQTIGTKTRRWRFWTKTRRNRKGGWTMNRRKSKTQTRTNRKIGTKRKTANGRRRWCRTSRCEEAPGCG